jgi:hypothetical protein
MYFMEYRFDFNDSQDEIKLKAGSMHGLCRREDFTVVHLQNFIAFIIMVARVDRRDTSPTPANRINVVNAISKSHAPTKRLNGITKSGRRVYRTIYLMSKLVL